MRDDARQYTQPPRSGERPCILVVDDDTYSRRLLARTLESVGFSAREASDGHDALAAISEEPPDLVLLDLQMPGLNGAETCAILRAEKNPAISELPVIMLTAHDDEEAEVRCLESGANDFLAKPVGRAALKARIQTQLRLHALSLELRAQNEELERWHTSQLADLESAKITQRAIIPTKIPTVSGWELENHFAPVIQVGGDVYGWRKLDGGRCVVWMADATGHGASAALLTTLVAHLFQQATFLTDEPQAILRDVNSEFFSLFHGKSFISACCACLESNGQVTFSSAGHPPLVIARRDGSVESFLAHATMIGVTDALTTGESTARLEIGDALLLFTDGLYSLRHPSGERMMWQTAMDVFAETAAHRPLLPLMLERLQSRSNGEPFDDDVTAIAARRTAPVVTS